ncbi:MAG: hypothetical protein PVH88_26795 [Ignavibacteria bacterium]|jgi:tetratricopeptide (TPR) repeat protein
MDESLLKNLENTFRNSSNSDELFDAFQTAISNNITDIEVYKILLGNPLLSTDEIKMYTDKLCKEFSDLNYDINLWAASIFENNYTDYCCLEEAFCYYKKASENDNLSFEPYLKALELYDYDMNTPLNHLIIKFAEKGIEKAENKSLIYYSLADLYKKTNNDAMSRKYFAMAEKANKKRN